MLIIPRPRADIFTVDRAVIPRFIFCLFGDETAEERGWKKTIRMSQITGYLVITFRSNFLIIPEKYLTPFFLGLFLFYGIFKRIVDSRLILLSRLSCDK